MKRLFYLFLAFTALLAVSSALSPAASASAQSAYTSPANTEKLYVGSNIQKREVTNHIQLLQDAWPNTNFNVFDPDVNYWWITNNYISTPQGQQWIIMVSWAPKSDVGHCSYGNRQYRVQWENVNDYLQSSYYCTLTTFDNYQWFSAGQIEADGVPFQGPSHENGQTGYGLSWGYEITDDYKINQSPQNWYPAISMNFFFQDIHRPNGYQTTVPNYLFVAFAPFQNPNNGELDVDPPSQGGNDVEKQIRQPKFSGQLSNLDITLNPYLPEPELPDFTPELDDGYTFQGYYIGWNIWKCPEGGYDSVGQVCNGGSPTLEKEELKPVDQSFSIKVSSYGTYQAEAEYWVQQCYRYPSYPATPDHCFYSQLRAHFNDADFDYINTKIALDVDGKSQIFDTVNMVCTVGGLCVPPAQICHNQPNFMASANCRLQSALGIGLLNPSLTAFKKLLSGIIVPAQPNCSIPLQDIRVSSKTIPVSTFGPKVCASTATMHQGFPIIRILINAVFALAILSFIIYRVNKLLDNRKNDILEQV